MLFIYLYLYTYIYILHIEFPTESNFEMYWSWVFYSYIPTRNTIKSDVMFEIIFYFDG